MEKRLLQCVVAVAGLVPVGAGLTGGLFGTAMLGLDGGADLDSHYRYLSGLLLAVGLGYWSAIPGIEHKGGRFALLTLIVVAGGFFRGLGMLMDGPPGHEMSLALLMELGVTPLLYVWRERVARLAGVDAGASGR